MRNQVKVKGDIAEKAKSLLKDGEKNLTPKRLMALLEELEQRRAIPDTPTLSQPQRTALESVLADLQASSPRPLTDAERSAENPHDGDGLDDIDDDVPPTLPATEPPTQVDTMAAMAAEMEQLKAKLADLQRQKEAGVADEAIGAGKLPVGTTYTGGTTTAPPRGLADLPRGKWIISPLGPKVHYMVCGCKDCTPFRLQHYHCSICKSGPYDYRQQPPFFKKQWMAPGGVWGIEHVCCNMACWMTYLQMIGARVGQVGPLDRAPVTLGNQPEPQPARVADESD